MRGWCSILWRVFAAKCLTLYPLTPPDCVGISPQIVARITSSYTL